MNLSNGLMKACMIVIAIAAGIYILKALTFPFTFGLIVGGFIVYYYYVKK